MLLSTAARKENIPAIAEAVVVPAPATIVVAIEVEEVPAAVRVAENLGELHPGNLPVVIEPPEGLLAGLLVEIPTDLGIETDVARSLDGLPAILAGDHSLALALVDVVLELDLLDVELGESQGPGVALGVARESIAILPSEPGGQAGSGVDGVASAADSEKSADGLNDQFAREKTLNALHTSKLVDHSFDLTHRQFSVLHDSTSLPAARRKFYLCPRLGATNVACQRATVLVVIARKYRSKSIPFGYDYLNFTLIQRTVMEQV